MTRYSNFQSNCATTSRNFEYERDEEIKVFDEVSISQRLSNDFTAGLVSNVRKNLVPRATYSLPRREGNRNEKTVCNTRYQPRNCRGAEREESAGKKTGTTGFAQEKLLNKVFFFFLKGITRAEPLLFFLSSPSFFFLFLRFFLHYCYNWSRLCFDSSPLSADVCRI